MVLSLGYLWHTVAVVMIKLVLFLLSLSLLLVVAGLIAFLFVLTPADRTLLLSSKQSIDVAGDKRTYSLQNQSSDASQPLVIALHGFRDRSAWMAAYSGLHILAEEEGFTLALPDGKRQSWNGLFCCGWSFINQTDDIAFIQAMIDDIDANYTIDRQNIFVLGFSNGGVLAQKLLAERPELFAAGASLMSGVGNQETQLDISNATAPLLLINGTDDSYVPLQEFDDTNNDFQFMPAYQTADIWAEHYGLTDKTQEDTPEFTRFRWQNDANRQLEQHIYDTTHRWPDWRLWRFPRDVPSATVEIWDFFAYHRR